MICFQVSTDQKSAKELLKYLVIFCFYEFCHAGTHFRRLIPDNGHTATNPEKVKRLIFCTGKIYYELTRERKNRGMDEAIAVVRIEQVISVLVKLLCKSVKS